MENIENQLAQYQGELNEQAWKDYQDNDIIKTHEEIGFTIDYSDSDKKYYNKIWCELEADGWRVKSGKSVDGRNYVTFSKNIEL